MSILNQIRDILEEVMDIDKDLIREDSYVIRDLNVESIDFLEIAVDLNQKFNIKVVDDTVFLRNLRSHINQGGVAGIEAAYPYLSRGRVQDIINDIENGPVLKVSDIVEYVKFNGSL